jgi:SAM-dependent methyltransferase
MLDRISKFVTDEELKMSIGEFFELLWINFTVLCRNIVEFFKVACRYYGYPSFLKADMALRLMYFFHNPYRISKRFLMKRGEKEVHAYGETPLTSLETIVKECGIGPKDCVYELGCGRGRTCFWLNGVVGCKVVGIEHVPEFVDRAERIRNRLGLDGIEFKLGDMAKQDYSGATAIYLYGTCLDDATIRILCSRFAKLKRGTKIITVSYALSEYCELPSFQVMKRFTVPFTWGEGDVFLQIVT